MGKVMIFAFELWKWSVLLLVIINGIFVTNCFIYISFFVIERNFLLRKKILLLTYGLKRSLQVLVWAVLILLTRIFIFKDGDPHKPSKTDIKILHYVTNSLIALLIGSVLWVLKSFLVSSLTSKFHMEAFFDRIQESIFYQYLLQALSRPPVMETPDGGVLHSQVSGEEGKGLYETDMHKPRKNKKEKVSGWMMKILVDIVRTSQLSTISNTLDDVVEQTDAGITSEVEAIAAAHLIFMNVANPGSKYIYEEDLLRFFIKDEVEIVFSLLQLLQLLQLEGRRISKRALKNFVMKAFTDRKALASTIDDTGIVAKQLNKLVTWILIIVIFNVWLLLVGLSSSQVIISQVLGAAFIFGNTCKNMFEGMIFVLAVRPFDVGDRCVIDGVVLLVEEVNIFNTIFLKVDNEKVYYPNSILATKPISNYNRSPDMGDAVEFTIDIKTPVDQIQPLKDGIKQYLESKPNNWHPGHALVVKEIDNENKLRMVLHYFHKMNFQNLGYRNKRRTKLVMELKKILEELKMKFSIVSQQFNRSNAKTRIYRIINVCRIWL